MKKNVMMRLAAFLLVAVLISTSAISGTYAKYISSTTGSDTARVAKWDIKFGDAQTAIADEFEFDLFSTVLDSNGGAEDHVANRSDPEDGKKVIAPGTSGSFVIYLANDSEVNAKYTIDYVLTNAGNIPVEFSVDGTNWYSDINYLDVAGVAISMGGTASITVQWHWIFENGRDAADTVLGLADPLAELTVQAKVTVEQVD